MKFSKAWLHDWVDLGALGASVSNDLLKEKLTASGFEVESCESTSIDTIFDISMGPNRADCLSVKGMAREIATIFAISSMRNVISALPAENEMSLPINIHAAEACPRYLGRIIKNINPNAKTPDWMLARLQLADIEPIHPVVDVTNYVMLELGQPMHAFDLTKIKGGITVRFAKPGETITLLDESQKALDAEALIIADQEKPLALAGVMGGKDSAITPLTKDIFLESAFFAPLFVARTRQHYQLSTDASFRFERGVDFCLSHEAMERASQLIVEIAGGSVGPIEAVNLAEAFPKRLPILLTSKKVENLLGISLSDNEIQHYFDLLHFDWNKEESSAWLVTPPSYRFDITIAEDLIEELARLFGYDNIPETPIFAELSTDTPKEQAQIDSFARTYFRDRDYHEVISYSFLDQASQQLFDPEILPHCLMNPISDEMGVMRTSLIPGLLKTMLYNKSRQQSRIRLFEIGTCFLGKQIEQENSAFIQETRLAGLMIGDRVKEQWGAAVQQVDFFDLKSDLCQFFTLCRQNVLFDLGSHPALHPGQTADLFLKGSEKKIGFIGALHPSIMAYFKLSTQLFVFEVNLSDIVCCPPKTHEVSRFPEIRRDLSLLILNTIPFQQIQATIKRVADECLKDIFIFDLYQGKGILPDKKSVALALIFQHPTRTFVEEEVSAQVEHIILALKNELGAELRS